ncbi:hypothetical protein D3C80_1664150 [compost metagenome]
MPPLCSISTSPPSLSTLQVPQMPMPQAFGIIRPTLAAAACTVSPGAMRMLFSLPMNSTRLRSETSSSGASAACSACSTASALASGGVAPNDSSW